MPLDYSDYEDAKRRFQWGERWALFDGSKEQFNIAHECIDRHPPEETAIRIKYDNGNVEMFRFKELARRTCQFANYLERWGVAPGDRVAILLFPSLELYVSMFGTFRRGAVATLCFPLFGPEAIAFRLEKSGAKVLVTRNEMTHLVDPELVRKLGLKIILADELMERLDRESDLYRWNTNTETLSMIQFSSGTTGAPKSIFYRHGAISVAGVVMKLGNGLRPDDTYFCPSSPGWGHGIWYGTIAPLIFGRAIGTFSGKFDSVKVLEALEDWGVTNMAAISSHYRLIMESGKSGDYRTRLRRAVYTGEAMSKDVMETMKRSWSIYPYVQYGTTEAGPITLDFGAFDNWVVKPGSLGRPMIGGIRVAVVDEENRELPPGKIGQVALWRNGEWVKMGDSAYMDEDNYFWYMSRVDDVIISAGYTIGPIEVEEALRKHPSVEECAVVGSPDKDRGDIVKAFIKLNAGFRSSEELVLEIREFVKTKLSKHEYPREIEFIDELPKTPDGKIKRKDLRDAERKKKLGTAEKNR